MATRVRARIIVCRTMRQTALASPGYARVQLLWADAHRHGISASPHSFWTSSPFQGRGVDKLVSEMRRCQTPGLTVSDMRCARGLMALLSAPGTHAAGDNQHSIPACADDPVSPATSEEPSLPATHATCKRCRTTGPVAETRFV